MTVNGAPSYIYYVSPTQVNVLTPPGAISESVEVVLTNGSPIEPFKVAGHVEVPSFFVFDGRPYAATTNLNGNLIGPTTLFPGLSTPAGPRETIVIYSKRNRGRSRRCRRLQSAGLRRRVGYAGSSGAPGEFQFNVVVPASVGAGDQAIVATLAGKARRVGVRLRCSRGKGKIFSRRGAEDAKKIRHRSLAVAAPYSSAA